MLCNDYLFADDHIIIDYSGLKIVLPDGWQYEMVFKGKTIKFFNNQGQFFLLSTERSKQHPVYFDYINRQGCRWTVNRDNAIPKTDKEFYTDLYLFTDAQLSDDSEERPWQYMILWFKTQYFFDTKRLIHYKGDTVEAFQKNDDPYIQPGIRSATTIQIFHERITSHYFEIGSSFEDDIFFSKFLNMLNSINP